MHINEAIPKIHVLSRIFLFRPDRPYFYAAFYIFYTRPTDLIFLQQIFSWSKK